jgi:hypothetical protein
VARRGAWLTWMARVRRNWGCQPRQAARVRWHVEALVKRLVIRDFVAVRGMLRPRHVDHPCIPCFLNMLAHARIATRTMTRPARTPVLLQTTISYFVHCLIPGKFTNLTLSMILYCLMILCLFEDSWVILVTLVGWQAVKFQKFRICACGYD